MECVAELLAQNSCGLGLVPGFCYGRRAGRQCSCAIEKSNAKKNKENWNKKLENQFKKPILDQFSQQSHPLYASARLWDDGIIDPTKTRDILATSLKISLNKKNRRY